MGRSGVIQFAGRDMAVADHVITIGTPAPEFAVQARDRSSVSLFEAVPGMIGNIAANLSFHSRNAIPAFDTSNHVTCNGNFPANDGDEQDNLAVSASARQLVVVQEDL